jgi:aspartate ammonia-lyase
VVVLLERAIGELKRLKKALATKADEFDTVIKMGRTHLQDAVPIRLGQEFRAYSDVIGRDIERFTLAQKEMSVINLGGTAIGTGLNADINYLKKVVPNTAKVTGLALTQNPNLIDGTANGDGYTYVSGVVKTCAVNLSKMCNDMRLMSSGPRCGLWEINLPPRQHGSTIMPGKVNPVIPEVVSQAAFQIIGNDMTVTMAAEAAQFQINVFGPVLFHNLFQSIDVLANAVTTLIDNCLVDITANVEHCKDYVENSVGIITALNPFIGYDKSSALAKEAIKTFKPVRELLLRDKVLSEQEIDRILDIRAMTEPGGISQ